MSVVPIESYDPESAPPTEVVEVLERGLVEIVRRVEFYEADAVTRWNPNVPDEEIVRLIEGAVTVDYNSDERRKLDLTLDNIDMKLRPNPNGGLWYDKVIKIFRGVKYNASDVESPLAIVESQGGRAAANRLSQQLAALGYSKNDILLGQTDIGVLRNYSYIFSVMSDQATAISTTLLNLFNQGKTVVTIGVGSGSVQLPHYNTYGSSLTQLYPDGGFESGESWNAQSGSDNPVRDQTNVRSGSWALKCVRGAGTSVLYGSHIITSLLTQGAGQYTVVMPVKIPSSVVGVAGIRVGGTGTTLGDVNTSVRDQYVELVHTFTWDGVGTVILYAKGNDQNSACWIDDITLYPGTSVPSWGIVPVASDTPVAGSFVTEAATGAAAGAVPTATQPGVIPLALWSPTNPTTVTAAMARGANGGYWIDIHLPNVNGPQARKMLKAAMNYVKFITPIKTWETQLGEFYIDGIGASNFPNQTKITARDATKKLMNDKLTRISTFGVGTSLKNFVIGQAALAGIPVSKMRFNIGSETLTSEMTFDKGTSRWDMIKSALESFNYERFFDAFGNFVVRKYLDPTTSPVTWEFKTGPEGNLVTFDKSVNDSRIHNHVIVTADPADAEATPVGYFGEAKVTDPNSPTHKSRIGNRVFPIDAPWISSNADAQALARERLKVTALESYELNFSSIYYAWLECGVIVGIQDPDALEFEPDRFLMDSINYSLGLGPMSATGKRVTFVGSSGGTGD